MDTNQTQATTDEEQSEFFVAGKLAHESSTERADNPYESGTKKSFEWGDGWDAAAAEAGAVASEETADD